MFGSADQDPKFVQEPEFLMRLPDKVEHGQALLTLRHPQSTTQLLQEYGQWISAAIV